MALLYQIEENLKRRQKERGSASVESPSVNSLVAAFAESQKEMLGNKVKMIGVPAPVSVHLRIEALLERTAGVEGMPKTKRSFVLACVQKYLDEANNA